MFDNRKRFLILLLLLVFVFSLFTIYVSSEEKIRVSARSAALYEPETKNFIYTKNANDRLGMASTTKIMTALIALEELDLNEDIAIDSRAVGIEGSSIYLKHGEIMNALDLIYALLLQSANDAALALAYRIADGIEEFSNLMNQKARELGLTDTHFTNPHGLDDKAHYTTAHDLALISAEAMQNDIFREITSTYKREVESSDSKRILVNHNKMLKTYDGCIGVKTGYTTRSGRCLVSAADREGLTVIAVTIDAPDDWRDHTKMLDFAYSLLEKRTLARTGEFYYKIPVLSGEKDSVAVKNTDELRLIIPKSEDDIQPHVKLSRYFSAPIAEGDILGEVIFTINGEQIASLPLYAEEAIKRLEKKKGFFSIFK